MGGHASGGPGTLAPLGGYTRQTQALKILPPSSPQVVTAMGKTWHPEHFVCTHCQEEIGSRNFFERDGQPYCEKDYHNLFSPRCYYCNGPILDVSSSCTGGPIRGSERSTYMPELTQLGTRVFTQATLSGPGSLPSPIPGSLWPRLPEVRSPARINGVECCSLAPAV